MDDKVNVYLKYVGNGANLAGVPARDLTYEEAKQHGEENLLRSGLYERATAVKPTGGKQNKLSYGGSTDKTIEKQEE